MRILAAVYNPIAYDGRVQRECAALARFAEVELLCPAGPPLASAAPFTINDVSLPSVPTSIRLAMFCSAFVRRARTWRPDVIHAHDYFLAVPGVFAAEAAEASLVYDAHELLIPEREERLSMRRRFWCWAEKRALKRAHLVIAANQERASLMREHYGLVTLPTVVRNIPPVAEPAQARKRPSFRLHASERLCVYQGDVSLRRGLGKLLDAVAYLPDGIRMLIVGGGPDTEAIRNESQRLSIEGRVTMIGKVRREELQTILESCDVGLLTYPFKGLNNIYCAPNKIYEYAQAGLPIVATAQPPLKEMLKEYRIGEAYGELDDPRQVAATILSVIEKRAEYRTGLAAFLAANTWEREAMRLNEAVRALAKSQRT